MFTTARLPPQRQSRRDGDGERGFAREDIGRPLGGRRRTLKDNLLGACHFKNTGDLPLALFNLALWFNKHRLVARHRYRTISGPWPTNNYS